MKTATTHPRARARTDVRYLVELSVLTAILLLLEMTGLGLIKTPGLEFTILQIPVLIGAIVLGPMAGGILGGVFGLISFWECFGKSLFGAAMLSINPFYTFLVCVPTRLVMGLACGLIFRGLHRLDRTKGQLLAFCGASLSGALLNTALFMGTLVACFYQAPMIQDMVLALGAANPFLFILAFVGVQGLLEALLCTVCGAAIARALYRTVNRG